MKFAVFLLILSVSMVENLNLFCFTCSYVDQKRCIVANNLPSENCPELTAAENASQIRAVCAKVINPHALYNKKYDRGCRRTSPGGDYCTDYMENNKDTKCYTCDYELCNGGNEDVVRFWMFILALVIVMYIKHHAYNE